MVEYHVFVFHLLFTLYTAATPLLSRLEIVIISVSSTIPTVLIIFVIWKRHQQRNTNMLSMDSKPKTIFLSDRTDMKIKEPKLGKHVEGNTIQWYDIHVFYGVLLSVNTKLSSICGSDSTYRLIQYNTCLIDPVADPAFRQGGPKKRKMWMDYPLAAKQPPHAFSVPGEGLRGVSPSLKICFCF